jgi:hypothetical protein
MRNPQLRLFRIQSTVKSRDNTPLGRNRARQPYDVALIAYSTKLAVTAFDN